LPRKKRARGGIRRGRGRGRARKKKGSGERPAKGKKLGKKLPAACEKGVREVGKGTGGVGAYTGSTTHLETK